MLMVTQLAGFMVGGERTIVQQASATSSNSASVTGPPGILAGDILVLLDAVWTSASAPPASSVPAGFTSITTATLGTFFSPRMTLSYKIATGAEASASITGMTGTGGAAKVLLVFRPSAAATLVTPADIDQQGTAGNPAAQTIASGAGVVPLIVVAGYCSGGTVDPRTFTVAGSPAKDGEVQATGTDVNLWLAWKIYNTTPADVVVDMDDEGGDNILESCYLQVA